MFKKYLISILIVSSMLLSGSFVINKSLAAEMSIKEFINLLITIGVIAPDKISAVNAWLATLENSVKVPVNITGDWRLTLTTNKSNYLSKSALFQTGNKYTGKAFDLNTAGLTTKSYSVTGTVSGNNLTERWSRSDGYIANMIGIINDASNYYSGTWKDSAGNVGTFTSNKLLPVSSNSVDSQIQSTRVSSATNGGSSAGNSNGSAGSVLPNTSISSSGSVTPSTQIGNVLTLDANTLSWQGVTVSVPNTQSYLDLSFTEVGTCSSNTYSAADVFINTNTSTSQKVRYREIQKGEQANFHIDLHDFQGKIIYPKINFDNTHAGSCFKLRIDKTEVNTRSSLFPMDTKIIAKRNALKDKFTDINSKGFGQNDHTFDTFRTNNFIGPEKSSLAAKSLNSKSFRVWAMPAVNFETCNSSDIHTCFDSADLNIYDGFFESLLDREIPLDMLLTPPSYKPVSSAKQADFMNIFIYKNAQYYDNNGSCVTDLNRNYFVGYDRFDKTIEPYIYQIPDFIFNRYKNGTPIIEVTNEANLSPHVRRCNATASTISAEKNYMYTQFNNFTKRYCDAAHQEGIVGIFGSFAAGLSSDASTTSYLSISNMLANTQPSSVAGCDYGSFHEYVYLLESDYTNMLDNVFTQFKNFWNNLGSPNKGIVISEFGYDCLDSSTGCASLPVIQDTRNKLSDAMVLTAMYYLVQSRDWMYYVPNGFATWGQHAPFDENSKIREPYYSQLKNSSSNTVFNLPTNQEICNNLDDNNNGQIDEGCDNDHDHYANSVLQCSGSFWSIEYNGDTSHTNQWFDGWWYLGGGWRGKTFSCSTNSGDLNDSNSSLYPGSTSNVSACTSSNWVSSDGACQSNNFLTRTWTQTGTCSGGFPQPASQQISCSYTPNQVNCTGQSCDNSPTDGFIDSGKICSGNFSSQFFKNSYKGISTANGGWVVIDGEQVWNYGNGWFQFPGSCSLGTYARTLWLYVDSSTGLTSGWVSGDNINCSQKGVNYCD